MSIRKSMSRKWSTEMTLNFVKAYKEQECLWNTSSPHYRDRQNREKALTTIIEKMSIPNLTPQLVKDKIKALRSTYLLEVKRIQESVERCSDVDGVYIPQIPWFHEMDSFIEYLKNKNVKHVDVNETLETDGSLGSEEYIIETHTPKRQCVTEIDTVYTDDLENCEEELMPEVQEVQQVDEFEIFGTHVITQLRQLSLEQALIAQEQIQSVLTRCRLQEIRSNRCDTGKTLLSINKL